MVMSIERLYSRQVPKSITGDPSMFKRGMNSLTLDEVLNILGQIQHKHPVGALILDAQIAMCKEARKTIARTMQGYFRSQGYSEPMAKGLAEMVTHEKCDTHICPKCHGTGESYSKRHNKLFECKRCSGVGRIIKTELQLLKQLNSMQPTGEKITMVEFKRKHYDNYMIGVDKLHQAEWHARKFARHLLETLEIEMAG